MLSKTDSARDAVILVFVLLTVWTGIYRDEVEDFASTSFTGVHENFLIIPTLRRMTGEPVYHARNSVNDVVFGGSNAL